MASKVSNKAKNAGNAMRAVKVDKLVLNISCGGAGDKLTKAARVLQQISGQEPVLSKARYTLRAFGIRRNEQIAAHVTIRGAKALEILERGLKVKEFELKFQNFSKDGTFCTHARLLACSCPCACIVGANVVRICRWCGPWYAPKIRMLGDGCMWQCFVHEGLAARDFDNWLARWARNQ
jgi:hypothetical protein